MKRTIILAAACAAVLAIPVASAGAASENSSSVAAKACAAEKKADKAAFKATYGKHAMRNCIKGTTEEVEETADNAAQQCKAERAADPAAFQATYGTNAPSGENSQGAGRNAMGKCVSSKVQAEVEDDTEDFASAADDCRAARDADPTGFMETWGTNAPNGPNSHGAKRNAFGKCVSATAQTHEDEGSEEPTS